jgi:DNA mismatch repair ATPase MutS
MSKIQELYIELKEKDPNKLYLFRCGKFYIFIGEDADKINEYVVLNKTPFTKELMKCGFPNSSLDNYMRVFKNHNLDICIIENLDNENDKNANAIIKELSKIDIDNISPIDALIKLKQMKDLVK